MWAREAREARHKQPIIQMEMMEAMVQKVLSARGRKPEAVGEVEEARQQLISAEREAVV